jgi:uncharacterized protein
LELEIRGGKTPWQGAAAFLFSRRLGKMMNNFATYMCSRRVRVGRARAHERQRPEGAKETYARALQEYQKFVTTNLILAETHAILRRRMGFAISIQLFNSFEKSLRVVYVYSSEELEAEAKAILRNYKDHDFSYANAVSFALMKQRGVTDVFTYDQHFRVMGFRIIG